MRGRNEMEQPQIPQLATALGSLDDALRRIVDHPDTQPAARAQATVGLDELARAAAKLGEAADQQFVEQMRRMMSRAYSNSKAHQFWPADHEPGQPARNDGEAVALMHSEVSELVEPLLEVLHLHGTLSRLLEVMRKAAQQPSEKIPAFTAIEEEAADLVIRLFEFAEGRGWRLPEAILAKHAYNLSRPPKHGKTF